MPVYEFYCAACHTIFNFLARKVVTDRSPTCPRCGRPHLDRQVSRFAISRNRPESDGSLSELDTTRLENVILGLAGELEGIDDKNPRQMIRYLRKFADATGISMDGQIGETISRLEAGADPEDLEMDLGDIFNDESLKEQFRRKGLKDPRSYLPPAHDETLYSLDDSTPLT